MIKFDWIQSRIKDGDYYFSAHGDQERQNDNLAITEIETKPKFKNPFERGENG